MNRQWDLTQAGAFGRSPQESVLCGTHSLPISVDESEAGSLEDLSELLESASGKGALLRKRRCPCSKLWGQKAGKLVLAGA